MRTIWILSTGDWIEIDTSIGAAVAWLTLSIGGAIWKSIVWQFRAAGSLRKTKSTLALIIGKAIFISYFLVHASLLTKLVRGTLVMMSTEVGACIPQTLLSLVVAFIGITIWIGGTGWAHSSIDESAVSLTCYSDVSILTIPVIVLARVAIVDGHTRHQAEISCLLCGLLETAGCDFAGDGEEVSEE